MLTRLFMLLLVLTLGVSTVGCYRPGVSVNGPVTQTPAPAVKPTEPPPAQTPTPTAPTTAQPSAPATAQPSAPATAQPTTPPAPQANSTTNSSLQEFIPFRDAGPVRVAIAQPSVVSYRVVNVGATEQPDLSAYLDDLMTKSKWPGENDLVLVVFASHNHDIRFGMGNIFRQKGVTLEELLALVRTHYLPEARKGQPEIGLADLIGAVNRRMN